MLHTIREQRELIKGLYGGSTYGDPTGKWEVGFYLQNWLGTSGWHTATTCTTRDEAIELCGKLNGGDYASHKGTSEDQADGAGNIKSAQSQP